MNMNMIQHPHCKDCGWAMGGTDSWDGNACKCKKTAPAISATVQADRMWRDPETRRRFEAEAGLAPLAVKQDELDRQTFEGHTQNYHFKFRAWALAQIPA